MEEGSPPILASMRTWFTPTILFLLLNLIVGTIFVSSKGIIRSHRRDEAEEDGRRNLISRSTSSVLGRLRSIGSLGSSRSGEIVIEDLQIGRSLPAVEVSPAGRVRKSASAKEVHKKTDEAEVVRGAAMRMRRAVDREEEGVDAKADDFINRFRNQLRLQRLDSIFRYKEMLNSGK